jgi:hypothetical protein
LFSPRTLCDGPEAKRTARDVLIEEKGKKYLNIIYMNITFNKPSNFKTFGLKVMELHHLEIKANHKQIINLLFLVTKN